MRVNNDQPILNRADSESPSKTRSFAKAAGSAKQKNGAPTNRENTESVSSLPSAFLPVNGILDDLTRGTTRSAPSSQSHAAESQPDYDDVLDDLVSKLSDGISTSDRTTLYLTGSVGKKFRQLVRAAIDDQGSHPNLEKALDKAKDDLFDGIKSSDDGKDKLDVFKGYMKRHGGADDANDRAREAFDQRLDDLAPPGDDYDANLTRLARLESGSVLRDSRSIVHLDNEQLGELYKKLIDHKLSEGKDVDTARSEVNDALRDRMHRELDGDSHRSAKLNIFDGYWDRHGGKADTQALAQTAYEAQESPADEAYDDRLNSMVSRIADGIDIDDRTTYYLDGDLGDQFEKLVRHQLDRQRQYDKPLDLDAAREAAKDDLFARIGNALDNIGKDSDKGLNVFKGYWDRHGGQSDATDASYDAFNAFIDDTVDTDNDDYEDTLNALSTALSGSVVENGRHIQHLRSSQTLSRLYKNLIKSKLADGVSPQDALSEVNDDLRSRFGNASPNDAGKRLDIFDGYWDRHGGESDADILATEAYKTHLGIDETDSQWATIDDSRYSSLSELQRWDSVTQGMDPKKRFETEQRLNRPLAAARLLSDHWEDWGLDKKRSFGDTKGLSAQGKAVLDYIDHNRAVATAFDVGNGHHDKADGVIQKDDVDKFVEQTKDDIDKASDSFDSYRDDHGNAGPMATELVRSAVIAAANEQILENAAPNDAFTATNQNDTDDLATSSGLSDLADDNPDLASSLTGAASLWSKAGMLQQLDKAGDDYATNGFDGHYSGDNIRSWIEELAPASNRDTASLLQRAAQIDATADVDVSDLGTDVFKNPDDYSGKQKAAVLEQLVELKTQVQVGNKEDLWDSYNLFAHGDDDQVNPNVDKVIADIQGKIEQLENDHDVGTFLNEHMTKMLQGVTQSDDRLHDAINDVFENDIKTGKGLNEDLESKDEDGNTVSAEAGLQKFATRVRFFTRALGDDDKQLDDFKLYEAVDAAGQTEHLKDVFKRDFLSGDLLNKALDVDDNPQTALQSYNLNLATFGAALPPEYVSDKLDTLQSQYSDTVMDHLLANGDIDDIKSIYGDGDGHLDKDKLRKTIESVEDKDPSAFTDADGDQIDPTLIVRVFAQFYASVDAGMSVRQAHAEWIKAINNGDLPLGVQTPEHVNPKVFRSGLIHAGSILLLGGLLGAQQATSSGKATDDVTGAAVGTLLAGALVESGGKYAAYRINESADARQHAVTRFINEVKTSLANGVSALGTFANGLGNGILAGLSLYNGVQELRNGDKPGAGLDLTSGISFAFASIAGFVDAGATIGSVVGAVGAETAAAISSVAGFVGGATAVIGGLAALGYLIYEAVKESQHVNAFNEQIGPKLKQWGITGGKIEDSDIPPSLRYSGYSGGVE